jgi:DNA-nicking Smr family endonuclease
MMVNYLGVQVVTEDDSELFQQQMGDVEPLKKPVDRVHLKKTVAQNPGMELRRKAAQQTLVEGFHALASEEFITPVKPRDVLSFKRDGVQQGVFKSLRLGKYAIDSRLDLHRLTVKQAQLQVSRFVNDCMKYDIRCALITHGRGENREKPALLKSCTNHWLQQMDEVLAFHSAQPQHGGTGATYLLLRKSKEKSTENFERHQKGKIRPR